MAHTQITPPVCRENSASFYQIFFLVLQLEYQIGTAWLYQIATGCIKLRLAVSNWDW